MCLRGRRRLLLLLLGGVEPNFLAYLLSISAAKNTELFIFNNIFIIYLLFGQYFTFFPSNTHNSPLPLLFIHFCFLWFNTQFGLLLFLFFYAKLLFFFSEFTVLIILRFKFLCVKWYGGEYGNFFRLAQFVLDKLEDQLKVLFLSKRRILGPIVTYIVVEHSWKQFKINFFKNITILHHTINSWKRPFCETLYWYFNNLNHFRTSFISSLLN